MSKVHIVIGIVLFALATAILYVWGLKKSVEQKDDLNHILLNRCGNKVVKYLRKHKTITKAQVAEQITGVTAGEFWSRHRLKVQDPKKFSQLLIESAGGNAYRLRK